MAKTKRNCLIDGCNGRISHAGTLIADSDDSEIMAFFCGEHARGCLGRRVRIEGKTYVISDMRIGIAKNPV